MLVRRQSRRLGKFLIGPKTNRADDLTEDKRYLGYKDQYMKNDKFGTTRFALPDYLRRPPELPVSDPGTPTVEEKTITVNYINFDGEKMEIKCFEGDYLAENIQSQTDGRAQAAHNHMNAPYGNHKFTEAYLTRHVIVSLPHYHYMEPPDPQHEVPQLMHLGSEGTRKATSRIIHPMMRVYKEMDGIMMVHPNAADAYGFTAGRQVDEQHGAETEYQKGVGTWTPRIVDGAAENAEFDYFSSSTLVKRKWSLTTKISEIMSCFKCRTIDDVRVTLEPGAKRLYEPFDTLSSGAYHDEDAFVDETFVPLPGDEGRAYSHPNLASDPMGEEASGQPIHDPGLPQILHVNQPRRFEP